MQYPSILMGDSPRIQASQEEAADIGKLVKETQAEATGGSADLHSFFSAAPHAYSVEERGSAASGLKREVIGFFERQLAAVKGFTKEFAWPLLTGAGVSLATVAVVGGGLVAQDYTLLSPSTVKHFQSEISSFTDTSGRWSGYEIELTSKRLNKASPGPAMNYDADSGRCTLSYFNIDGFHNNLGIERLPNFDVQKMRTFVVVHEAAHCEALHDLNKKTSETQTSWARIAFDMNDHLMQSLLGSLASDISSRGANVSMTLLLEKQADAKALLHLARQELEGVSQLRDKKQAAEQFNLYAEQAISFRESEERHVEKRSGLINDHKTLELLKDVKSWILKAMTDPREEQGALRQILDSDAASDLAWKFAIGSHIKNFPETSRTILESSRLGLDSGRKQKLQRLKNAATAEEKRQFTEAVSYVDQELARVQKVTANLDASISRLVQSSPHKELIAQSICLVEAPTDTSACDSLETEAKSRSVPTGAYLIGALGMKPPKDAKALHPTAMRP